MMKALLLWLNLHRINELRIKYFPLAESNYYFSIQERKEKLQGHIPKAEKGLKEYLESEEGQAEREKNRLEFEKMAENVDSDASGKNESAKTFSPTIIDGEREEDEEAEEPEVDISRMSKSEKKKLTKGKKDKVEEFSLDTF